MQVKPFFDKSFKIVEEFPVCKDDTGNNYILAHIVGEHAYSDCSGKDKIKKYDEWLVMSDNLGTYSNGATGFEEALFWKSKSKELLKIEVNGFLLQEVEDGSHCMFWPYPKSKESGLRTRFEVKKI